MQTNPTLESSSSSTQWKIKLLYDGECPLCVREVNFLQKRDRGRGLVAFVDIAEDDQQFQIQNVAKNTKNFKVSTDEGFAIKNSD